jgi:hypothetical protein
VKRTEENGEEEEKTIEKPKVPKSDVIKKQLLA